MKTRMFLLAALVAVVMVAGFSHGAFASGGGSKTRIALSPSAAFPHATGKAAYRGGSEAEFEAQVDNVKRLAGQTVNVFVNGVKVGSTKVNALGTANFNRSVSAGQSVPTIKAGYKIQIKTAAGVVIVSGSF